MKFLSLTLLLIFTNLSFIFGQGIVINEIMSSNETTITDEDGDYPDWIELYNSNNISINLSGYTITDDISDPDKWTFPEIELLPDSFLLVFASGKDRLEGPFLHTNFKIVSEGEDLVLTDNLGNEIDHVLPISMPTDVSYGRKPDGGPQFLYFDFPSPGFSNSLSNSLSFSHERGFYTNPFMFFITSESDEDQVYFTLDGSLPTTGSELFQDSILMGYKNNLPNVISEIPTTPDIDEVEWKPPAGPVEKANIIRIRSFNNSIPSSKVYTLTFFVDPNIFSRYPYPVLSLVTEASNLFDNDTGIYVPGVFWDESDPLWTGNYYQTGSDWERDIHIEYFDKTGEIGFFQDAGVRIHGKQTRRRPQKTFRLYARKEYGKDLFDFQLLPQKDLIEYKRFLITTSYGCWNNTVIKDVLTNDIIRDFEMDIMDYRLVVVFLNGEYWGIQNIREFQDENHLSLYYGIDKNSIDLLRYKDEIMYGSNESYNELVDFIRDNDISIPENYSYVASQIDIDNFIDYQIAEIYFNNYDWPATNIKFWRSSDIDNKWRWLFYDIDGGWGVYSRNQLEHATLEGGTSWPNPDWSTLILRKLLENDMFRELFLQRFANLLNTTFQPGSVNLKIQEFVDFYEQELPAHIYRWGFPDSINAWKSSINWSLYGFANNRPCVMREHIIDYFDLEEFGFSCDTNNIIDSSVIASGILFPNPNKGRFSIMFPENNPGNFLVQIYNSTGAKVYSADLSTIDKKLDIDTGKLTEGLYILHAKSESLNSTYRFVILR